MENQKILAIDYGSSKIGLAVSDRDRTMAFGRGILRPKNKYEAFLSIKNLILEENIGKVIFGLPLLSDGEDTKQSLNIRDFAKQLMEFLSNNGVEILLDFIDESFSTFEAGNILRDLQVDYKKKKETEDELSAIILLNRYIDFKS